LGVAVPVIVGLAVGIAFIVIFDIVFNNSHFQLTSTNQHQNNIEYSNRWIKLTKEMDEVKAFLAHYPTAKTTVYNNVRIVDYLAYDNITSKFANLRLQIAPDNSHVTFAQIQCAQVDAKSSEVTNQDSVREIHGQQIFGIAEFLQDDKCPQIMESKFGRVDCKPLSLCTYNLKKDDTLYPINFRFNGTIENMTTDLHTITLTIQLKAESTTSLQIAVPREVVDSRTGGDGISGADDDLVVFVDQVPADDVREFSTKEGTWAKDLGISDNPEKYRILVIHIEQGTKTVDIVGTLPI